MSMAPLWIRYDKMTFSGLLDTFKGFFSRAFWFSRFLPVALVATTHLMLAIWIIPLDPSAIKGAIFDATPTSALLWFAAAVILAYAIGPAVSMLGGLLDGSLLPQWCHDELRKSRFEEWERSSRMRDEARRLSSDATLMAGDVSKDLKDTRDTSQVRAITDSIKIETACFAVKKLESKALGFLKSGFGSEPIDLEDFHKAGTLLRAALEVNSADLLNDKCSEKLDDAHVKFDGLLTRLEVETGHRYRAAVARCPLDDPTDWQPTRFGDARKVRDRYCIDSYGVGFDFLWPRVRLAITGGEADTDQGLPRHVVDGSAQADFSVLLLALALTVPAFWLPSILYWHKSMIAFVATGVLAPVILAILYELAVQSEMAFATVVASAIDRYRLEAFPLLKLKLPPSRSAEKALWQRLERSGVASNAEDMVYIYPGGPQ